MTNRQRFFYNGILLTSVGLIMRTVQLLFGAYIAREVGAEGIGLYTLVMTVYSFAVTFATSGISLTVTRLVASAIGKTEDERSADRILHGAVFYSLGFGIVATLCLFFFSGIMGSKFLGDIRATVSLQILSSTLIPVALGAVFSGYFVGVRRVFANATVQVLGQVIRVLTTVILVLKMRDFGVEYAVMALCIGSAVTEILSFLLVITEFFIDRNIHRRKNTKKGSINKVSTNNESGFSDVASMALPLAFSAYIRSALLSIEHSLIPKFLIKRGENAKEALSSYGFLHGMALPMLTYPMSVLTSFAGLLVPEFAEANEKNRHLRMKRIADETLNTTLVFAVATSAFLSLFAEELGYVVYNSYDAGHYIALISPVVPIMYLDHVTDSMLKGIGEQVFSMWVNIADATLSVVLVAILIPVFGISGYAFVIVGMETFNFVLSAGRLKKRINFKIDMFKSFIIPLFAATMSSILSKEIFAVNGTCTTPLILTCKIVFAFCSFIALRLIISFLIIIEKKVKIKCKSKNSDVY